MTDLIGRHFKRREPHGDDGDVVVLQGTQPFFPEGGGHIDLLIVASLTFGAVPPGWEEATALLTVDEFAQEYRPLNGAERAVLATEQAIATKEADANAEERLSPWAYYVAPPQRRTKKAPA